MNSCRVNALLLILFLAGQTAELPAQTEPKTAITGQVVDAEAGAPLENAIIFLANTPFGTSSAKDGTFRITGISNGVYEMIASRLGYERQAVSIKLGEAESLYFKIRLRPEPIRTKGVEVFAESPKEAKPTLFFPSSGTDSYTVFGGVSSLPIGMWFTDSALYMYALDTAVIDSEKYIRLWLLYRNLSEVPRDFNPVNCLRLHVFGKGRSYRDIQPEPPPEMRLAITMEEVAKRISDRVEKTISALLNFQSMIKPGVIRSFENMPLDAGQGTKADRSGRLGIRWNSEKVPVPMGTSSKYISTTFQQSFHAGILQRCIVHPKNSVDGFVYFPFPGLNWNTTGSDFSEASEGIYIIEITSSEGTKTVEFVPR